MASRRPPRPVQAPRDDVIVPPELALGALVEVWGDSAQPHGALHEQAMARFAWNDAARAWESSVGIGPYEHDRRLPRPAPWPPLATLVERLAALGLSPTDLPRLRRAAGARIRATESRRTT